MLLRILGPNKKRCLVFTENPWSDLSTKGCLVFAIIGARARTKHHGVFVVTDYPWADLKHHKVPWCLLEVPAMCLLLAEDLYHGVSGGGPGAWCLDELTKTRYMMRA